MKKHTFYRLTPLLLLILFLLIINLAPRWLQQTPAAIPAATAVPLTATPLPVQTRQRPSPPRPVTPSPEPTRPPPTPTIPAQAAITLWGPPGESQFMVDDVITFYWTWPLPLAADWRFHLYWLHEEGERDAGALVRPNLGAYAYRLTTAVPPDGHVFAWQVRLQTGAGEVLAASEARPIRILAPTP